MKKFLLLLTVTLCVVSASYAMLGETKQQSANRYGKPFLETGNLCYYKQKGFVISEWFNPQGIAEVVAYYKLSGTISNQESSKMAYANLPPGIQPDDWIEQNDADPACRLWVTLNGKWCWESGTARAANQKYPCSSVLIGTVAGVAQMNREFKNDKRNQERPKDDNDEDDPKADI